MTEEHAVLVYLRLGDDSFGLAHEREQVFELEDAIDQVLQTTGVGEHDGHDFGEGFATMYLYGADADAIYLAIEPVVRRLEWTRERFVIRRYGEPGAREERTNFPAVKSGRDGK